MGRFMFSFLSSSQDDFKWGLDALEMLLSLKRTHELCEQKVCFMIKNTELRGLWVIHKLR